MNSRGTLMMCLMKVDTLDNSERVAMVPTIQPAAGGTQWNADLGRVVVTVIGPQDIRSCPRWWGYLTGPVYFSPGP